MGPIRLAVGGLCAAALLFASGKEAFAQDAALPPSTLRWGSGLLDVPVADVLPHLAFRMTYSGFQANADPWLIVDAAGETLQDGPAYAEWLQDASFSLGFGDRLEIGATLQSFNDAAEGGNLLGGFGKINVMPASIERLSLAVGARYVTAPSWTGYSEEFQPSRLGIPDSRLHRSYRGRDVEVSTTFSPYAVLTAHLTPRNANFSASVTGGYGRGHFSSTPEAAFYGEQRLSGIFGGLNMLFRLTDAASLGVLADYNGYDINAGANVSVGSFAVGAFVLDAAESGHSLYDSRKVGILASVTLCGEEGGLCSSPPISRPDTVMMPAPPPDTVVIERIVEPPLPTGAPAMICLSTGAAVEVLVTASQDTLVGGGRVSIKDLRPGVVFGGRYAEDEDWYRDDEPVEYDEREYSRSGGPERLDCGAITRVGEHMGIPIFARRADETPLRMIFIPARPGIWQGYEADLQKTRGLF